MRKHPKLRGLLCGVLLGATILCLFVSTFAALGCLLLALLICPAFGIDRFVMRTLPRGGMRFLAGLIAVLLCVLGFALTLTTEPESAAPPAPSEAPALTADPVQTAEPTAVTNPLDTALTIYPMDVPVEYASTALPLTADIWDGSTVPPPGTVYYVDGTISFEFGYMLDALYLDSDFGEILALNYRIVYDGVDVRFYTAHTIPDFGEAGRFILTYAAPPSDGEATPVLLYGANEHTITVLATVGEALQLGDMTASPTATPAAQDDYEAESSTAAEPMNTYVCNVSSKVFHRPSCSSVKNMADYNKQTETCYASTLIAMGYTPCSKCNPN